MSNTASANTCAINAPDQLYTFGSGAPNFPSATNKYIILLW